MTRPATAGDGALGEALVGAFRRGGYAGASLRELQSATGLGAASLYHRFAAGKVAMATAALDHVGEGFATLVLGPLVRPGPSPDRLAASAEGVRRFYDSGRLACLLAVFTLSDAPDPVRVRVADAFAAWQAALAAVLDEAGVTSAAAVAQDRIAGVQGALILARAGADRGAFDRAVARLGSAE